MRNWIIVLIAVLVLAVPALAQENGVTADEVNAIAKNLYCPVCENIPLDACGTAACEDWRYEIELMLGQGLDEEAIRQDFINRFGERVVGTPQDPALRALSLVTPWVISAIALGMVVVTMLRLTRRRGEKSDLVEAQAPETDPYRRMLEQDLSG